MQKDKLKQILIYVIPFIAFIIIFGFTSACGGEASKEKLSIPEEQEIIGYRETEDWGKVSVVEWEIGKPIDYPSGPRLILNKVWTEKVYGQPYVVINETLVNTTGEVQDGFEFYLHVSVDVDVWDSQDNRFSGSGGLEPGKSIWAKIDELSPGDNKKWPPGKELTGNIYFDVSGNTGGLMVELEYSEFIRPNVIYRYVLEDTEAKTEEEIVIPIELEAREKIEEGVCEVTDLSSDRQSLRKVVNWLPADWQVGILVVKDDNPTRWGEDPQMHYYLEVKSQGGVLDVTWGVQNFYYYKSWTEIEKDIVKNYPPDTIDWAGGSFITGTVWSDDPLWQKEELWEEDTFWENEFWD
ncbi:hypothetical protein ES703_23482 [subsurface metagenome]